MRRLRPARLALRARVVLFTSAIVVVSLLLLGITLRGLLAEALYTQQRDEAVEEVQRLVQQASSSLASQVGLQETEVQRNLLDGFTASHPGVAAVVLVLRNGDGTNSAATSDERFRIEQVPPPLVNRVFTRSEMAYVYTENAGSDRMLVIGAPLNADLERRYEAYFFYPVKFQGSTLALLTNFLLVVGIGLLAAVVVIVAISIGRVLKPIQHARDVAEEITSGNLQARIPQADGGDDFGRLAESFNRMTDALGQKITELQNLSALQARFVSDVSHELRTPLSTVRMAADYIHAARGTLPADAQRAAVLLERELERFENLLEDLLEISRFDAGVINLEPVEVELREVLEDVIDALQPLAHGRKVDIVLAIDEGLGPPVVEADPRRLDRVFSNLVKNAIEHTSEGRVTVEASRQGGEAVVRIRDDGEGIDADDLPHIFERFYRADVHRARAAGGTGLGLAIARENVHLHGGRIEVGSTAGEGSTFTVTLPAATATPKVEARAESGEVAVRG